MALGPGSCQSPGIEGERSGEQYVEHHAQAVDVGPRVDVQTRHAVLLRAHERRRAQELADLRDERVLAQAALGRFGDSKVDDLGQGLPVLE